MANNSDNRQAARQEIVPRELLQAIRAGECVLFVGAGLSKEAGYPDGRELARKLRIEIREDLRPEEDRPLSEVAQAFEASRGYSRAELVAAIKKLIVLPQGRAPDSRTLRLIAHIPYLNRRIITTNWDSLIEEVFFEEFGEVPAVVVQDMDVGRAAISKRAIYKIHGSLEQENTIVVTDLDYRRIYYQLFEAKSLLMAHIRALLTGNRVIYVGFSLQDPDFEELLGQIQSALKGPTGYLGCEQYAIVPRLDMSEVEYKRKRDTWRRKHVEILDCTAREFFEGVYQETSEFKNREREINLLLGTQSAYIEVVGNVGSGKSQLLKEIKVRYEQELRWPNPTTVDLKRLSDHSVASVVSEIATKLGNSSLNSVDRIVEFSRSPGILLLVDSIDRASLEEIRGLCVDFFPKVIDPSPGLFSRIIWATRYSIKGDLPFSVKRNLLSFKLSMLSENVVADMVQEYASVMIGRKLDGSEARRFASEILRLTGDGHPGLVKKILWVLKQQPQERFSVAYLRSAEGERNLLDAMMEVIKDILPTDGSVCEALKTTLCVPRGVHSSIVDYLQQQGWLSLGGRGSEAYMKELVETHLFDEQGYPLFRLDPVVRHVLKQDLRASNESRLAEVNSACCSYFRQMVLRDTEDRQRAYYREWLYHRSLKLQLEQRAPAGIDLFDCLKGDIRELLASLALAEDRLRKLTDEIQEDMELSALLEQVTAGRASNLLKSPDESLESRH